jgi:hypothetical protein
MMVTLGLARQRVQPCPRKKSSVVGLRSLANSLLAKRFADDRGPTTGGEILGSGNGRVILEQPGL